MKILHIIPSISSVRGGPSVAVIAMVKNLRSLGIDAEIVTTNDNGNSLLNVPLNNLHEYQSVPVRFFARFSPNIHPIREFAFSSSLTTWLSQHLQDYNLIHVHAIFSYPSTIGMVIARWQNVPYIIRPLGQLCRWSLQQSAIKKAIYLKLIEEANINCSSGLHLTSEAERQESDELNLKCPKFVIPHGLTVPPLIPDAHQLLRTHFQLHHQERVILFLSRIHPKKGLELLIKGLAAVKNTKFTLIIAGSGNPDYEAKIKASLQEFGLMNRSLMPGFVEGRLKQILLQGADLFALTSYSENFGVAVLEALAAGTPALVTPGVALAQEITQNNVGFVVPEEVTSIAKAVENYLNLPETEQINLRQKARQFVLNNYSWDKVARKLITIYENIISQTF